MKVSPASSCDGLDRTENKTIAVDELRLLFESSLRSCELMTDRNLEIPHTSDHCSHADTARCYSKYNLYHAPRFPSPSILVPSRRLLESIIPEMHETKNVRQLRLSWLHCKSCFTCVSTRRDEVFNVGLMQVIELCAVLLLFKSILFKYYLNSGAHFKIAWHFRWYPLIHVSNTCMLPIYHFKNSIFHW